MEVSLHINIHILIVMPGICSYCMTVSLWIGLHIHSLSVGMSAHLTFLCMYSNNLHVHVVYTNITSTQKGSLLKLEDFTPSAIEASVVINCQNLAKTLLR